ncbi:bacillithiol biosynthesis cysteine-adding enzyme BshC [Aquisalibacillus elongatus]|uniref:Putative cysteine ligase BshC n=1 Tax=Aquisalibacillus elongatus TaxID=485577 RepID=A0A3N5BH68_9BACI|nr:bacillithiol biosynthesis cysteine-adding enzyme BshC [Aquisalibacillus elongatus]RPF56089.1 bacillithiol biosynthesis cysteine-adding enzyme BshC [Aquisalibacillus elongatus]
MKVHSVHLPKQSALIQDYRNREESIMTQFHYDPYQIRNYKKRHDYLSSQDFKREALTDALKKQYQKWGTSEAVLNHIEALNDPNAVVVIGGQQAGLFSGPLYTIHKIISIIVQAKEQREYLQQPVIPVFWMAGEDHDFEEINHVYTYQDQRLHKHRIQSTDPEKTPVSKRVIDKESMLAWINDLFKSLRETEYTNDLYERLINLVEDGDTYVDLFAKFTNTLFAHEGLVLVDSDADELRDIEADYFVEMVQHQNEIAESVVDQIETQEDKGYSISLDATTEDGHLFYHVNGERFLLERKGDHWLNEEMGVQFTTEELIQKIKSNPRLFSNNVVTRPIMQEYVFPVLSFVGGPGEIAYWSVLKPAFERLGLQFPIVMPRLSLTLLGAKHEQWILRHHVKFEDLISKGIFQHKMNWLNRQTSKPIEEVVENVKQELEFVHKPLQDLAFDIQDDLGAYAESNLDRIHEDINQLEKRIKQELRRKHQQSIRCFDELNHFYYPNKGLQERVWNIVYFMNEYGPDLPFNLLDVPPRWEQDHLVVSI